MVSVIIPCYNYGHLISDSLESVLRQSYTDIEVIVINDGSTDNTEEVVKRFLVKDERVKYKKYANSGLGNARNKGIEAALGKYIQFLDADDLLEGKKFEEQLKIFNLDQRIGIVYGSVRYFTKNPACNEDRLVTYWGSEQEWMPKLHGMGHDILARGLKGNFAHLSSVLFRKDVIETVGCFDNDISAVADYHYLLLCAIRNIFFYYHDFPGTYSLVRWHPNNMSKDPNYMREQEIKMRKKLFPELVHYPEADRNNKYAIKALSYQVNESWKKKFLSGGQFDVVKKYIRLMGLENILKRIFYK